MFFKRKRTLSFEDGYKLGKTGGELKGNNDLMEAFNDLMAKLNDDEKKEGDKILKCLIEACEKTYSDARKRNEEALRKIEMKK